MLYVQPPIEGAHQCTIAASFYNFVSVVKPVVLGRPERYALVDTVKSA
jgi:hypothetical protein